MAKVPRVFVPQSGSASKFFPSLDLYELKAYFLIGWVILDFVYCLVPIHNHTNRVSMMTLWISKYQYQLRYWVQKLS